MLPISSFAEFYNNVSKENDNQSIEQLKDDMNYMKEQLSHDLSNLMLGDTNEYNEETSKTIEEEPEHPEEPEEPEEPEQPEQPEDEIVEDGSASAEEYFNLVITAGKSYEIHNLSEQSSYSLKNNSNYSNNNKRYDYSRMDSNGSYSYAKDEYRSLNLSIKSQTIVTAKEEEITFYIPYELYDKEIIITEVENPALYYFSIEVGTSKEIKNTSEYSSLNIKNDSNYNKNRYDYSRMDSNGSYSYAKDDYGNLSLPIKSQTIVTAKEDETTFYIPYELYDKK